MAVPTMDFDWLLDHASAIAFDPSPQYLCLRAGYDSGRVTRPGGCIQWSSTISFAVAQAKFIDDNRRGRYRGQLPRVGLTLFEVNGHQCGIVLSYHSKFEPNLAQ